VFEKLTDLKHNYIGWNIYIFLRLRHSGVTVATHL